MFVLARYLGLFASGLLLVACEGVLVMAPNASARPSGGEVPDPGGIGAGERWGRGSSEPPPRTAGAFAWQRLTAEQLDKTTRDLLQSDQRLASGTLSADVQSDSGFLTAGLVTPLEAQRLATHAEQLVISVLPRLVLGDLLPCDPVQLGEKGCAHELIAQFGRQAFRRPLDGQELEAFLGLFTEARTTNQDDFRSALGLVMEAMLQSPPFLYVGGKASGELLPLDGYELASRLSYFLWQSMPDDTLMTAASNNELSTPQQIEAQTRRMLESPEAQDTLWSFHQQWLDLSRLAGVSEPLTVDAMAETRTFASKVLLDGDGLLTTLLQADYSYLTPALGTLYGVTASATGAPTKLPDRSGLLTQASVLRALTDPIRRGKMIRESLLCEELPAPPPGIPQLPPIPPGASRREIYEAHTADPSCNACHRLMDPIGFGFEKYDASGALRTTAGGQAFDDRGVVRGLQGEDVPFTGALELGRLLATSAQVQACLVVQWLRFAVARRETAADTSTLYQAVTRFDETQHNVRELIVALTVADSFRFHSAP